MNRNCRRFGVTAVGSLLAYNLACGEVIKFKDGRELSAVIVSQTKEAVWILNANHKLTKFAIADIASIATTEDLYRAYYAKAKSVGENDAAGHVELAKWCFSQLLNEPGKYELRQVVQSDNVAALRRTISLALANNDVAIAKSALAQLRSLKASDAVTEKVGAAFDELSRLDEREKAATTRLAAVSADLARTHAELASANTALANGFIEVTKEERVVCPKCWGTGVIVQTTNSWPNSSIATDHVISVGSVLDPVGNVIMQVTSMCPECKGARKVTRTVTERERVDGNAEAQRRDGLQRKLDELNVSKAKLDADLEEIHAKRKQLLAELAPAADKEKEA
jgi:hypothetical protein